MKPSRHCASLVNMRGNPFRPLRDRTPFPMDALAVRHNSSHSNSQKSSQVIRKSFIDFFAGKGHVFVPSSSVIPKKDEGTYFVNAGMNQFKPVFLGISPPPHPAIVNSQKCIRVGGKHNDLDEVGFDSSHHTFFEMLGTWSFSNADKESACASAWELLTQVYGFSSERLYVSVFGGDENLGLAPDRETYDVWQKIGVSSDHISWGSTKDNFWEMGETGPCGVSTEIHYDVIGGGREASSGVNVDGSGVIEMWNLVFIEHERESSSLLRPLCQRHLDTGLGFERLVAAAQGKTSNYDTDLFMPIFDAIRKETKTTGYGGRFDLTADGRVDAAYRIIADHVRMMSIAIADGLLPSSKGLGSKLRQVIERASHELHGTLNTSPGSLANLTLPVIESLSCAYPELGRKSSFIHEVVDAAENHFFAQKLQARRLFQDAFSSLSITDGVIAGDSAWDLCDSKNIPLEILSDLAAEKNLVVDIRAFEEKLEDHKIRSLPFSIGNKQLRPAEVLGIIKRRIPDLKKTIDTFKYDYSVDGQYCLFPGIEAQLVAIMVDGAVVDSVSSSSSPSTIVLVFNGTNFYAEAGGQRADEGTISCGDNKLKVVDVQGEDGYVLHFAELLQGQFKVGQLCTLSIDPERRMMLMANHSATHLLNFALRKVVGESSMQMGSKVDGDKFTFDFYTTKAVDTSLIQMVEETINIIIAHNMPVFRAPMSLKEAMKLEDLVTLETEVYPDSVSVISVGLPIHSIPRKDSPDPPRFKPVSLELCCGTHVLNTGAIEEFVITHVGSVGHNVKRITAVTRDAAREASKNVSILSSHVETFEAEMGQLRHWLLGSSKAVASTAMSLTPSSSDQCSSSSSPTSHSSLSSSPTSSSSSSTSSLPTFEEVEAKLNLLKTNLRENPLSATSRLELEQRISNFGPEMARLKHIQDLKAKDEMAARIYDQLSTGGGIVGEKFAVRELQLDIGNPTLDDYRRRAAQTALARAPRQLQNVNNNQRLPGLFLFKLENNLYALGYVPDEVQHRLTASEWVLHSLSALNSLGSSRPKGNPLKKKLSERLLYFGWVENIDQPEECLEICAKSSRDLAAQRLS